MPSKKGQPLTAGLAGAGVVTVAAAAIAGYVLTRTKSRAGYSSSHWRQAVTDTGSIPGFEDIAKNIANYGLVPSIRAQVWPFLLGVFDAGSTQEQRQEQHDAMVASYSVLLHRCQNLETVLLHSTAELQELQRQQKGSAGPASEHQAAQDAAQSVPEHVTQFGEAHRIIVIDAVRTDFRKQSLAAIDGSTSTISDSRLQLEQWMGGWLNRVSAARGSVTGEAGGGTEQRASSSGDAAASEAVDGAPGSSEQQQQQQQQQAQEQQQQQQEVQHPAVQWVSVATQQVLDSSPHLDAHSKHQAARLVALLSAYAIHDPQTGYCQGMSDLAVPFITLMDDDALAFACFSAVMARARHNFAVDESGIFAQLRALSGLLAVADRVLEHRLRALGAAECHFAYRMIVVLMRRDLPLGQAMVLWEMLWADDWLARSRAAAEAGSAPGTSVQGPHGQAPDLFLCFVAAVVMSQRRKVLDDCTETDDVLRLFHSVRVDFWDTIEKAKQLRAKLSKGVSQADVPAPAVAAL